MFRIATTTFALASLLLLSSAARAGDAGQIDRARNFLSNEQNAKGFLGFLHFGCTHKGSQCTTVYNQVNDASGNVLPGQFALKMRHRWTGLDNGNDYTDVTYFFNAKGRVYSYRIDATSAIFIKPFAAADLVIDVCRQLVVDLVRNNPNQAVRNNVQQIARTANARRIFQLWLELSQP